MADREHGPAMETGDVGGKPEATEVPIRKETTP